MPSRAALENGIVSIYIILIIQLQLSDGPVRPTVRNHEDALTKAIIGIRSDVATFVPDAVPMPPVVQCYRSKAVYPTPPIKP